MKNDELKAWRARLSLGEAGMAAYLGVPVTTYRKWENGTRSQDASTLRLFDVLRRIGSDTEQRMALGDLHDELIDTARGRDATIAAPKRRGRKPKPVTPAAAPAQPVEQSTQVPAWLVMASGS